MTVTGIRTFDSSIITTKEWLEDIKNEMSLDDQEQAVEVTRAVLHTIRDRLTVNEAADFAAQLPMLLQGLYYHEWTPAGKPEKIRSRDEFLAKVSDRLMGRYSPEKAIKSVFNVLENRMSHGQIEDVKDTLPPEIRELIP